MWVELIKKYCGDCEFSTPADAQEIESTEKILKLLLHNDLKAVLMESNGILGEYELGLLWTVDRIKSENLYFRSYEGFKDIYEPFDNLLFFADAGNGDRFTYLIQNGQIHKDIFVWNHEDDSRNWVAPDLISYFEWWLSGKMKI